MQGQAIVQGYEDNTFRPDRSINRAEFTKIIVEAVYDDSEILSCLENTNSLLKDVERDAWFAKYVCVAAAKQIVQGYPDGTFRPSQDISFVEAAKIIAIAFGHNTQAIKEGDQWFTQFVRYIEAQNSIPTSINALDKKITRGEMAEMIYRLKTKTVNKPSKSYTELTGTEETTPTSDQPTKEEEENNDPAVMIDYKGEVLAGSKDKAPFLAFNQEDYEAAVKANKTIYLYYYATWCPICIKGVKEKIAAFDEIEDNQFVGFRVNWKDDDTDEYEDKLAKDFAVTFQSSSVIVKGGEVKYKTTASIKKDKVIEVLKKAAE